MRFNVKQLKNTLSGNNEKRLHILLACMPKSGSTLLSDILGELPGLNRATLTPAGMPRELELDEYCLQQVDSIDYICPLHVRNSAWTENMSKEYNLKTVVLIRSLFDIIPSMRDHVRNDSPIWSMFYLEEQHTTRSDSELELMITRLAIPWFINFYMGWRNSSKAKLLTYEEASTDPVKTVHEIMTFCGSPISMEEIAASAARVKSWRKSRLNVGVSGRGNALQPETVRSVLEMLSFYPEAAEDPYFQSMRIQAESILTGSAPIPAVAKASTKKRRPPSFSAPGEVKLFALRRVLPILLVTLACLYWFWQNDFIPDTSPSGILDDMLIAVIFIFLAGRLSKFKLALRKLPKRPPRKAGP